MRKYRATTQLLAIVLTTTPLLAHSKNFGKNAPFIVDDLPAGTLKSKLLTISSVNKDKALKWLNTITFNEDDLNYLKVDDEGGIFYSDTFSISKGTTAPASTSSVQAAPQPISAIDAFKLHSKPGATNIIYLDFDGHVITGTAWNTGGPTSYNAKPFDTDGTVASFSSTELSAIQQIWHRVAEDYAPFNVDVTTELPASFGPTVGRVLITHNIDSTGVAMPSSTAGGVAYVGVWGGSNYASTYSPALVYYNNLASAAYYISEAASHEMGHNLSLSHDGTATVGYYTGHGTGFASWAPIMGVGYYQNVTEWSKGEYTGANNLEDDISLITARLTARTDDHSNALAGATPLLIDTSGAITVTNPENDPLNTLTNNKGIIEKSTDVDYFAFKAGVGPLQITINPAWAAFTRADKRGANLDIQATLYDQAGTQIAQVDPVDDTNAIISASISADGQYYLAITGVGNSVTSYSDYGSLGQYYISGSVTPSTALPDTTAPTPSPMAWDVSPNAGTSSNSISMTATPAIDESGSPVQYQFACVSGGAGCVSSNWQASNQYTATGLIASKTYNYQVKAKDASGNETAYSATAAATTAVSSDTIAPTPNPMTWSIKPAAVTSSSISMTATVATDNSATAVQYMFLCASGGVGCVNSSWQASNKYTATGLAVATAYTFQVKAKDMSNNETAVSLSASATTKNAIPITPTNLSGVRPTTTTASLTWDKVSNATSYDIWRCTVVGTTCNYGTKRLTSVTTNSYSGTVSTSAVRYKVSAVNTLGKSGFSNEVSL
ncbi:zinc-dependent metalloprotease family protein [Crenothrix sp.]|uniref:zinc-dependent metalloprotease family protein n=1 Tax=Crenothrix sp. TaxID=3100433 RepID=UPI00374DE76B